MTLSASNMASNILALIRDEGFTPDYRQAHDFIQEKWSKSLIDYIKANAQVKLTNSASGASQVFGTITGLSADRMVATVRDKLVEAGFDNPRIEQDIGLKSLCTGLVDDILNNGVVRVSSTQAGLDNQGPIQNMTGAALAESIIRKIGQQEGNPITGEQNVALIAIADAIIEEIQTYGIGHAANGNFTLVPVVGEAMVSQVSTYWTGSNGGKTVNSPVQPNTVTAKSNDGHNATDNGAGVFVGNVQPGSPFNSFNYTNGLFQVQFPVPFAGEAPATIDYSYRFAASGVTLYGAIL